MKRHESIACNLHKSEVTALELAANGKPCSRKAARVLRELELLDAEGRVEPLGFSVLHTLNRTPAQARDVEDHG